MLVTADRCLLLGRARAALAVAVFLAIAGLTESNDGSCSRLTDGSLGDLLRDSRYKFFFAGGKGGVGKSSVSSAIAIRLAEIRAGQSEKGVLLLSTDPAHSLGDAFRQDFAGGKSREAQGVDGLRVLELDPQVGVGTELSFFDAVLNIAHSLIELEKLSVKEAQQSEQVMLEKEIKSWAKLAEEAGMDEVIQNLQQFTSWLSSIPGIDEATALASVVDQIEGGKYSAIVFDTAPTGHTLKLLQLPDVLDQGLTQIRSWQTKLWSFYQMFTSFMQPKNGNKVDTEKVRKKLEKKLEKYQNSIQKVATMIKDNDRTTFIAVCIAEYLSVSETKRLLSELRRWNRNGIHSSHLVINQLLNASALSQPENDRLMELKADLTAQNQESLSLKIETAIDLIQARSDLQRKYIKALRDSEECECMDVVEVPLLPIEITGSENLRKFSSYLVGNQESPQESSVHSEL